MALARPLTKAEQAATRHDHAEKTATQHPNAGNGITLGSALDKWYIHLQASERIKSEATIRAYRYGVGFLADSVGSHRALADEAAVALEMLVMANHLMRATARAVRTRKKRGAK